MMEQQRQAYRVEGIDEEAPALDPKKRKAVDNDKVGTFYALCERLPATTDLL